MIVDLGQLPYRSAIGILHFCADRGIDLAKCIAIGEAFAQVPVPDIDWCIDIPDKYISWILLNWPMEADI